MRTLVDNPVGTVLVIGVALFLILDVIGWGTDFVVMFDIGDVGVVVMFIIGDLGFVVIVIIGAVIGYRAPPGDPCPQQLGVEHIKTSGTLTRSRRRISVVLWIGRPAGGSRRGRELSAGGRSMGGRGACAWRR